MFIAWYTIFKLSSGSHGGKGEKEGIKLVAESLNIILAAAASAGIKGVSCMIETTAGQGTAIGYRFEQIREIINLTEDKDSLSVCIDTAHIWAAGYNIKNVIYYNQVIKEFDDIIGLDRLKCFHLNDSKKPYGSRVDRHDHIGKGFIGLEGFSNLMNDKKLTKIPKILETPKGKECLEDIVNMKILLSLIKS